MITPSGRVASSSASASANQAKPFRRAQASAWGEGSAMPATAKAASDCRMERCLAPIMPAPITAMRVGGIAQLLPVSRAESAGRAKAPAPNLEASARAACRARQNEMRRARLSPSLSAGGKALPALGFGMNTRSKESGRLSAVDRDRGALDMARALAAQEQRQRGDVLRLADAAQPVLLHQLLARRV